MKNILKYLLATCLWLFILSRVLPNLTFSSLTILIITSLVLAIVQIILKPILSLLLLPITIITLGIFGSILNVGLLWLVTAIVPGFHIDPMIVWGHHFGFFSTLVILSIVISWGQRLLLGMLNLVLGKS